MFKFKYEAVETDENPPSTNRKIEEQKHLRAAATRRIILMETALILSFTAILLIGIGLIKHWGDKEQSFSIHRNSGQKVGGIMIAQSNTKMTGIVAY